MQDEVPEPQADHLGPRPLDRRVSTVQWATWVGLLFVLIGLIDGVVMALRRKVADCPDGTMFPAGTTDHTCYVHPQAGLGIAVAALSVALGSLIVMASIAARSVLADRSRG